MKQTVFFLVRKYRRTGQSAGWLAMAVMLLVLAMAGCVSKKYDGPRLSDEDIAVVRPDDKQFTRVNILAVDELGLKTNESGVAVTPGEHVLFLEAWLDYPLLHGQLYFNLRLPFEAEAGDTYTVHATILPMEKKGFVWLTSEKDPEKFIAKQYAVRVWRIHFE